MDAISFLALGKVFTAFMTGTSYFSGCGLPAHMNARCRRRRVVRRLRRRRVHRLAHYHAPAAAGTWPRQVTVALGASLIVHAGFVVIWLTRKGSQRCK